MEDRTKYILAVPNISEGRRKEVIEEIISPLKNNDNITLIDYEPEHDFNRTVIYVIGKPEPLKKALLKMAGKAYELIDMEEQEGSHPRIGAQDTIPLFPFKNITVDECKKIAEEIGEEIYDRFKVPVYFSGENARNEERKELAFIRNGQYEGLKETAHTDERKPDIGTAKLHETAGATIVSAAAEGLTAYNVILDTDDIELAKKIAKAVRGPSGGFSTVRAIGVKFPEFDGAAVSMNLFDCTQTPIYRVFEFIKQEARSHGVMVKCSEIVGPVKLSHLLNSLYHYLGLVNFNDSQILETHLYDD